jgi:hypothetical protein
MSRCFDSHSISRLAAQVILMLLALALNPSELRAQKPAPKPPKEVLREFRKMDSEGGRLTINGWYRAAHYFTKSALVPRNRVVEILGEETISEAAINGERATIVVRTEMLGQIDPSGRFKNQIVPSLLDPSGELHKKPFGLVIYGPTHSSATYDFVLTDTHWEFTPDGKDLREVRGALEWKIVGLWRASIVTVPVAIGYLTRLHDETSSEVIKRNAKKSIADIQRLANRARPNAKPRRKP